MTTLQWAALCMQGALALLAKRFPRLRRYMALALGLNLARLALQRIDVTRPYVGIDLVVVLLEGLLFVASPIGLAWALKAQWKAVGLFVWTAWAYVVVTWPRVSGAPLLAFYLIVQLVAHMFIVASTLWRASGRKEKCPEERALLLLAAVGLSGTVIALVWRDDWGIVNAGNMLTYALLGLLCIRRQTTQII